MTTLPTTNATLVGSDAYLAKMKAQLLASKQTDPSGNTVVPRSDSAPESTFQQELALAGSASTQSPTSQSVMQTQFATQQNAPQSATSREYAASAQPDVSHAAPTQPAVTPTESSSSKPDTAVVDVASRFGTPYFAASGHLVIPTSLPEYPDLAAIPARTIAPTARVIDPATGKYAPRGFESRAQLDAYRSAIVANSRAMYAYFQEIGAIIDHGKSIIAATATPDQSVTPPQGQ